MAEPAQTKTPIGPSRAFPDMPHLNKIGFADIGEALAQGINDFRQAPAFGLFFGGVFALSGLIIVASVLWLGMPWMIYPFAIGFPLIGPFAAVGLYEVSRRRERGEPLVWSEVLSVIWRQRSREFSWMAFVSLFIFWIWIYQVRLLIAIILGFKASTSLDRFFEVLVTTQEGVLFLIVGHIIGAMLALVLYSVTVVSLPFLLERSTDFITAIVTSIRAVFTSPVPMLVFGVCVTILIIVASLPLFIGFLVVLPVLGHATWHLYRRIVPPLEA